MASVHKLEASGAILKMVEAEREAKEQAVLEAYEHRKSRLLAEQKHADALRELAAVTAKLRDATADLTEEEAECERLEQELEAEKTARLIAETRLLDAQQTIAALRSIKPAEQKPDPAIPRIEAAIKALLQKPAPVIDMTGLTFDIRRDEFGKPKQIVMKEK